MLFQAVALGTGFLPDAAAAVVADGNLGGEFEALHGVGQEDDCSRAVGASGGCEAIGAGLERLGVEGGVTLAMLFVVGVQIASIALACPVFVARGVALVAAVVGCERPALVLKIFPIGVADEYAVVHLLQSPLCFLFLNHMREDGEACGCGHGERHQFHGQEREAEAATHRGHQPAGTQQGMNQGVEQHEERHDARDDSYQRQAVGRQEVCNPLRCVEHVHLTGQEEQVGQEDETRQRGGCKGSSQHADNQLEEEADQAEEAADAAQMLVARCLACSKCVALHLLRQRLGRHGASLHAQPLLGCLRHGHQDGQRDVGDKEQQAEAQPRVV